LLKVKKKGFCFALEKRGQKRTSQFFFFKNNITEWKFPDFPSFCEILGNFPFFSRVIKFPGKFPVFLVFRSLDILKDLTTRSAIRLGDCLAWRSKPQGAWPHLG